MQQNLRDSMDKKTKWIIGLLILLVLSLCGNVIQFMDRHNNTEKIIFKTDTITVIDTVTRIQPEPIEVIKIEKKVEKLPIYVTKTDTDSIFVEVPYEKKTYEEDSLYKLQISGHNPNLDYIQVFPKTKVITNTIEKTITKHNHFNATIGIGAGYGIINKKPDIFVGGVIGYSF